MKPPDVAPGKERATAALFDAHSERIGLATLESGFLMEVVLRRSDWTPSIVPHGNDRDVYLVVDDLGRLGRVWREADYETTDFETVVTDLLGGQYGDPFCVVSFNSAERWSRDVSVDVAAELRRRCNLQMTDVPSFLNDFVDRYDSIDRSQLSLPLGAARANGF